MWLVLSVLLGNGSTLIMSMIIITLIVLGTFSLQCVLQDICKIYPCEAGRKCIRRGGVTCLDANGCDPDDLRLCGEFNLSFAPFLSYTTIVRE